MWDQVGELAGQADLTHNPGMVRSGKGADHRARGAKRPGFGVLNNYLNYAIALATEKIF